MFDGVILGDACLIVMSSTRRLQAITGNAGFFRGGYHNVIVVFSPYRGSTVAAAASSATLTVSHVQAPSPTETAPTYWQSISPLFLFLIFIQSSFGHYQTTVCRNIQNTPLMNQRQRPCQSWTVFAVPIKRRDWAEISRRN